MIGLALLQTTAQDSQRALEALENPTLFQGVFQMQLALGLMFASYLLVTRVLKPRFRVPEEPSPFRHRPGQVAMGFGVYLLASVIAGICLGLAYPPDQFEGLPPMVEFAAAAGVHGLGALGIFGMLGYMGAKARDFGLQDRLPWKGVLQGLVMYLSCLPALFGAGIAWHLLMGVVGYESEPQGVAQSLSKIVGAQRILVFFFAAIAIPFLEEFLFRGFLQNWLVKLGGARAGILAASVFFALLHGISPFGPLLVIALSAGLMLRWTGSLWGAVGVHAANNSVSTLTVFFVPDLVSL